MVKAINAITEFILYAYIFIACCAVSLCMATERLVVGSPQNWHNSLHLFVFGATLIVYNLPFLFYRNENRLPIKVRTPIVLLGILVTTKGITGMSYYLLPILIILGVLSFGYSIPILPFVNRKKLRDFGWLKILVLASVWTVVTSILPIIALHISIVNFPYEILLRFVFIFCLCVIFDIRDLHIDRSNNISTVPQKLGLQKSYRLIDLSLIVYFLLSVVQFARYHTTERLVGAIITAIIMRTVATYLRKKRSEKVYLFLADGLMMFYSILVLL